MKRVALVAAHFPPSNLAAVHRSRLWAEHLPEFGWEPVIITAHWKYYEEKLDWDLHALVPPGLRVIRTRAVPVKPVRLVGDLGVRAFFWQYRALCHLAQRKEIDFLHITIPSNFSAPLGRLVHRRCGTPYGIDYIDPWVHHWPGTDRPFSKAWLSYQVSRYLEPWSLRHARLITGVAPLYYEDVIARNAWLRARVVTASMPYGGAAADFVRVQALARETFVFDAGDGCHHMVYAGAMLPRAYPVLESLFRALKLLAQTRPELMRTFRLHFIGTGRSPDDPVGHNVQPYIERYGLREWVSEHPRRIPYTDVLNHLLHASAVLILGSTEPHYSPSKVFQAVQSQRPILALLHEKSMAASLLRAANQGIVVGLTAESLPTPEALADAIVAMIARKSVPHGGLEALGPYSARDSARALAAALDRACDPVSVGSA